MRYFHKSELIILQTGAAVGSQLHSVTAVHHRTAACPTFECEVGLTFQVVGSDPLKILAQQFGYLQQHYNTNKFKAI